jgi:hypothetical protein
MTRYPLFFTYSYTIPGSNFLATIKVQNGRALMVKEDNDWWMYGVCPGSISEGGQNPQEAYMKFCESFKEILEDIAFDKKNFHDFEAEVKSFALCNDPNEEKVWLETREEIRNGRLQPEGPFNALKRITDDPEVTVSVTRLDLEKSFDVAADNQLAAAA